MLRLRRIPYRLQKLRQWQRNISDHATPASPSAASPRTSDRDEDSELDFDLDYDFDTNLAPTEDGTRTLRTRNSGRTLPVSPILDPALIAAKNRHKNKKADPSTKLEDLTPLQLALRRNPYAQALATPVRQELVTGAFLPRHFLQAFGTVFKQPRASPSDPKAPPKSESKPKPHIVPVPSTRPDRVWVLNTHTSISRLNVKYSWHRLIKPEMMDKLGYNSKSAWGWDPSTAEIVLRKLKSLVSFKLRGVLLHAGPTGDGHESGVVVLDQRTDVEADEPHEKGTISDLGLAAIVLFEPVSEEATARLKKESTEGQVYDLCALLGEKTMARIQRGTQFENIRMMGLSIGGPESLERKNVRMVVASLDRLSMYMKDMQRRTSERDTDQLGREGRPEVLHEGDGVNDQELADDFDSLFDSEEGEKDSRHEG
ncbi:hypothetical protein MBLNU457_g3028t1 [Dothideomycetes sp. NU457]